MIATQYIKLNMVPSGYPPVLYMSQYDVGRPVGFVVSASGSTPDLDGYTVTLEGTRSDGTPVTAPVTTDGNICALETTATMTNKVDRYPAQIVVTDGNGNRIASIPVTMMVVKAAMNENAEGVEEDRSLYQQYTGTVQSLIADIRTQLNAETAARQAADNQLQSNINAEASTRATQDASLQSQINQLVAPEGSAPSAAEVENARVGADGTVYQTLGDAIRTQNTQLKSQIDVNHECVYVQNEYPEAVEITTGYWSHGIFTSSATCLTKVVPLNNSPRVRVMGTIPSNYDAYVFLDSNNNVISFYSKPSGSSGDTDITVDVPANAVKVASSASPNSRAKTIAIYLFKKVNAVSFSNRQNETALKTDTDALVGATIDGFEKTVWVDVLDTATLYSDKIAEMLFTNKLNISSNSRYKAYELNVTPGEKYKVKGTNVFDTRPVIYTDDDYTVVSYYPTARKTTDETITTETIVPDGATKLFVGAASSLRAEIFKYAISFKSTEEEDVSPVTVKINTANTLDTTVVTTKGETIRQRFEVFNNTDQPNSAVLPRSVEVYKSDTWKTIVNNEDDNCPVNLSSGHLGAGHGYDRAFKITLTSHGKTYADIGSEWESGTNYLRRWWIVRIIDEDNLVVIGNHDHTSNDYDTDAWGDGTTLRYISGAVHTSDMEGITKAQYLLAPVDKNHVKKVMLDGVTSVSDNGTYTAQHFVDIIDEYDVVNPQDIAPEVVANKPSGGYTENPPVNTGDTFLHFSNIYRVFSDGTMLMFTTLDNDVDVTLGYWGGTQYAQKSSLSAFGGSLFRYVPKAEAVDGHDLRIPIDMANWNYTVNLTNNVWEDADNPPDRLLQLFTNGSGTYVAGYAVGYLPLALGAASVRKNNISNAMNLYYTKKAYFHLVDSGGTDQGAWSAYTPLQSVIYRKPIFDLSDIHTDVYFVPYGEKCYMYADYHAIADDRIKVPAEYVGKPMTVVEKSSNVTVYGTIATDEIRIRCATADPMYGYAVIQIG